MDTISNNPHCQTVSANVVARKILEEVSEAARSLERKPLLVGFLASEDPAARTYAEWTSKTCVEKYV